jgi:selenide,water dikinase
VQELAAQGVVTGASARNWAAYGQDVHLPAGFTPEARALLSDPQTSGGLLVSCAPDSVDEVLAVFKRHGFEAAAVLGHIATALDKPGQLRIG